VKLRVEDWRPLLAAAAMSLCALFLGGRFFYFLLYFSTFTVALALGWVLLLRANLTWNASPQVRHVVRGRPLPLALRLYNEGLLPAPSISVRGPGVEETLQLDPFRSRVWEVELSGLPRGKHRPGPYTYSFTDPFGIFSAALSARSDVEVVVYPRTLPVRDLRLANLRPYGRARSMVRGYEDPAQLAEIRLYRQGDPARRIHWRTTARRGLPHVKEFELSAAAAVHVFLEMGIAAYARREEEDLYVEAALSVVSRALSSGYTVSLHANSRRSPSLGPCAGTRALGRFREFLCYLRADGTAPLARVAGRKAAYLEGRTSVLFVIPHLDPPLHHLCERLLRARFALTIITARDSARTQALARGGAHLLMLSERGIGSEAP